MLGLKLPGSKSRSRGRDSTEGLDGGPRSEKLFGGRIPGIVLGGPNPAYTSPTHGGRKGGVPAADGRRGSELVTGAIKPSQCQDTIALQAKTALANTRLQPFSRLL
jgi:hypothetical protein